VENVATRCEQLMRGALGDATFAELVRAMLDADVAPADLGLASWPVLIELRDQALDRLRTELGRHAESERRLLSDQLPWYLRDESVDLEFAVLWVATQPYCSDIPLGVFDLPGPESRVLRHLPELEKNIDDDGLLNCAGVEAQPQALFYGNHVIRYHQFLRDGWAANGSDFSGLINDSLLRVLLAAADGRENLLRLAIDDSRIAPRSAFTPFAVKDYWWGPHLSEHWLDDPAGGCTVHEDPAGQDAETGYVKFMAYWRMDHEGHKVAQMEEVVGPSSRLIGGYQVLRYLHSIRDIENHFFIHCDGAVRAYDAEGFMKRQSENMPTETRAAKYRKVFRVDGSISTKEWSDITAKWFRHNNLAIEYLATLADSS
jgi:hypothetical protein